ncbi:putative HTH-type transcriptional regulator YusO [Corynebacterium capitovis DSM 44611]|uniref:MarR family winged helix-turn-helix transcriptional regulator n=1 Tax=Corynebacterium capitovis TaxID=131081 RepID=UPI00035C4CEA|nr:MarR family transcriptional regulator [Corynebacterium capitovis]WKD57989.1 putative HTH-type transcriptional regulator YusO [Corynebacterium capitovis DSM 44611]
MPTNPPRIDSLAEAHRQWATHYSAQAARGLSTLSSVARAAHLLRAGAEEALQPFKVSFAQFELLTLLMWTRSGGLPMSKISSRLHVPPGSLTHTVCRLEKEGLIARTQSSRDRRSILVSITDQGVALASAAGPELSRYFEETDLTEQQHRQIVEATAALRRAAGEFVE